MIVEKNSEYREKISGWFDVAHHPERDRCRFGRVEWVKKHTPLYRILTLLKQQKWESWYREAFFYII